MRKTRILLLTALSVFFACMLYGCSIGTDATTKLRNLDFTVVSEDRLSEELQTIIEDRKEQPFKVTFSDADFLYICIGYGKQSTGGYSITVNDLYLTDNAIYVNTCLLGPGPEDKTSAATSYPYIVIKTEYLDKTVVFD